MKALPLRFCTGGCRSGAHAPHVYSIDPVDGQLGNHICPGNTGTVMELLEDGEPTGHGFIRIAFPPLPDRAQTEMGGAL